MYYAFAQVPDRLLHYFSSFMSVAVRTKIRPLEVVQPLRQELRARPAIKALYGVCTMEQLVSASLARQRFLLLMFGLTNL